MPGVLKYKDPTTNQWTPTGSPLPEGTEMDLLWENASPGSNFSPQTINVDSTGYKFLYVLYRNHTTSTNAIGYLVMKDSSYNRFMEAAMSVNYHRAILEITDGTIKFDDAKYYPSYSKSSSSANNENSAMIPLAIYGIK